MFLYTFLFLQFRLMRKTLSVSHSVSPSLVCAPYSRIARSFYGPGLGGVYEGGICGTPRRGRQHCVWRATRWEASLESCGTSGVPIGGESLAVAPYLMDPATVLLERFAKRCTHGVLTPPGFAGYGLGLLDSWRSSQLNTQVVLDTSKFKWKKLMTLN